MNKKYKYTLYLRHSERYGVNRFSKDFVRFLTGEGYTVNIVVYSSTLQLLVSILNDRWSNRVSITSFYEAPYLFLNRNGSVLVLHGFPNRADYSLFKYTLLNALYKISSRLAQNVVSNSYITHEINKKFFNIPSDYIWNPCMSEIKSLNSALPSYFYRDLEDDTVNLRKPNLIFVGRVTESKGISLLLESVNDLARIFGKIEFIGPVESGLRNDLNGSEIRAVGPVSQDAVEEYYRSADIFISLNALEPFGLTIQEAVFYNLITVCPQFSGALSFVNEQNVIKIPVVCKYEVQNSLVEAVRYFYDSTCCNDNE